MICECAASVWCRDCDKAANGDAGGRTVGYHVPGVEAAHTVGDNVDGVSGGFRELGGDGSGEGGGALGDGG